MFVCEVGYLRCWLSYTSSFLAAPLQGLFNVLHGQDVNNRNYVVHNQGHHRALLRLGLIQCWLIHTGTVSGLIYGVEGSPCGTTLDCG